MRRPDSPGSGFRRAPLQPVPVAGDDPNTYETRRQEELIALLAAPLEDRVAAWKKLDIRDRRAVQALLEGRAMALQLVGHKTTRQREGIVALRIAYRILEALMPEADVVRRAP